jgi:hypothetical protein
MLRARVLTPSPACEGDVVAPITPECFRSSGYLHAAALPATKRPRLTGHTPGCGFRRTQLKDLVLAHNKLYLVFPFLKCDLKHFMETRPEVMACPHQQKLFIHQVNAPALVVPHPAQLQPRPAYL